MGESYVDQLIEEANKLCEVGRLDFWRDFGDESRDPDLGGSWYGYDVYLIAPKKNKKNKETIEKLRGFFEDWD